MNEQLAGTNPAKVTQLQPQLEYDLPFEAIGWRIIVQVHKAQTHSPGGIELPTETVDVQDANQYQGTVVSKGPLAYLDPAKFHPRGKDFAHWCELGDVVAFNKYGGQKLETKDGQEFRILNDEDILVKITDPDAMFTPY